MNSIHNTLQTVGCKLSAICRFIADKASYIFGRMVSLCKTIENYLISPYRRPQEETFNEYKKLLSERKVKIVNTNQINIKPLYHIGKFSPNNPKRGEIQKNIEQSVHEDFKRKNTYNTSGKLEDFRKEVDEFFTKIKVDNFTAPEQQALKDFRDIVKSCHGIINLFIGIYSTFMENTNLLQPTEYKECLVGDGKSRIFSFTNQLINNLGLYEGLKKKGSLSPDDLTAINKLLHHTNALALRIHNSDTGSYYLYHSPDWNHFNQHFSKITAVINPQTNPTDDVNPENLRALSSFSPERPLELINSMEKIKDTIEYKSNNTYHYKMLLGHFNKLTSRYAFVTNLTDSDCIHNYSGQFKNLCQEITNFQTTITKNQGVHNILTELNVKTPLERALAELFTCCNRDSL